MMLTKYAIEEIFFTANLRLTKNFFYDTKFLFWHSRYPAFAITKLSARSLVPGTGLPCEVYSTLNWGSFARRKFMTQALASAPFGIVIPTLLRACLELIYCGLIPICSYASHESMPLKRLSVIITCALLLPLRTLRVSSIKICFIG